MKRPELHFPTFPKRKREAKLDPTTLKAIETGKLQAELSLLAESNYQYFLQLNELGQEFFDKEHEYKVSRRWEKVSLTYLASMVTINLIRLANEPLISRNLTESLFFFSLGSIFVIIAQMRGHRRKRQNLEKITIRADHAIPAKSELAQYREKMGIREVMLGALVVNTQHNVLVKAEEDRLARLSDESSEESPVDLPVNSSNPDQDETLHTSN